MLGGLQRLAGAESEFLSDDVAHFACRFGAGNISGTVRAELRSTFPLLCGLLFQRLNRLRQRHLAQNH